jgi:hypothetical protein
MSLAQDIAPVEDAGSRARRLNERLAAYIPPKDTWNPADEAVFKPVDLYRVPLEEAQEMQLKSIKFTFTRHYRDNDFYHRYCEMRGVRPDDIKTLDDLDRIPSSPTPPSSNTPQERTLRTGSQPSLRVNCLKS